jgi:hypothetical protein
MCVLRHVHLNTCTVQIMHNKYNKSNMFITLYEHQVVTQTCLIQIPYNIEASLRRVCLTPQRFTTIYTQRRTFSEHQIFTTKYNIDCTKIIW